MRRERISQPDPFAPATPAIEPARARRDRAHRDDTRVSRCVALNDVSPTFGSDAAAPDAAAENKPADPTSAPKTCGQGVCKRTVTAPWAPRGSASTLTCPRPVHPSGQQTRRWNGVMNSWTFLRSRANGPPELSDVQ